MRAMDIAEHWIAVAEALLGRSLNDVERVAYQNRLADPCQPQELAGLVREIVRGDEFFLNNRESYVHRLFPRPCVVAASTPMGGEVFVDLRQFHLGFAIATGHFEPIETAFVRRHVRAGDTVFDIGANMGYYTVILGNLVGNSGTVHAFEPVDNHFTKLQSAVRRSQLDHIVRLHKIALSDQVSVQNIIYSEDMLNTGGAHLAGKVDHAEASTWRRESITTSTLDLLFPTEPADFVKLDVEGAEWLILQGGADFFRRQAPVMMIEFNAVQLRQVSGVEPGFLLGQLMELGFIPHEMIADGVARTWDDPHAGLHAALARTGIANIAFAKRRLD